MGTLPPDGTDKPKKVNGGRRPGAGRKIGGKNASTIEKEALRDAYRQLVAPRLQDIVTAQLASATGLSHFMLRDPVTGQWDRITDPDQILAALNAPPDDASSRYMIFSKDPNQQATTDLLNRLMDKPAEQEQKLEIKGNLRMIWDDGTKDEDA